MRRLSFSCCNWATLASSSEILLRRESVSGLVDWVTLCLDSGVSFSTGIRKTPKSLITVTSAPFEEVTFPLIFEPSIRLNSVGASAAMAGSRKSTMERPRIVDFMSAE